MSAFDPKPSFRVYAVRHQRRMRLWTIHPQYLDPKGLVALWRESLLARAVLRGKTKGYRHHPQLHRFLAHPLPRSAINAYLATILLEAQARGYSFNRSKVGPVRGKVRIRSTEGQIGYEWQHLLRKLRLRSPVHHRQWCRIASPEPHPIFQIVSGPVEVWERGHGGKRPLSTQSGHSAGTI
jgi:hypothetical protein